MVINFFLKGVNNFVKKNFFWKGLTNLLKKMDNFFVKPNEIVELIKKRYEDKNNNGEEINLEEISSEEINNFVIKSETDRFNDLFDQVFEEKILSNENFDSEDGPVNEICLEIISKIKSNFEKVDKLKLLEFMFKLIKKVIFKKEEEEEE